MDIRFEKTTAPAVKPDSTKLGFGRYFTDHMFIMDYSPDKGWHDARIVPFANLSLHPAATVFHYGAEVFEGMKESTGLDLQSLITGVLAGRALTPNCDCAPEQTSAEE